MSTTKDFETFSIEWRGSVAEITLTRPELMDRFDAPLHSQLTEGFALLRADHDVRAIVLGSTGKYFSAGGDFDLMLECHESMANRLRIVDEGRRLMNQLLDMPQPIIVALQGGAIGLGASVALACDAVVAARTAFLSDTHVSMALVAGDGGCLLWPLTGGSLIAKRYLLSGDRLSAEDAFRLGMVTDLVDTPEETLPAARALAERLASLPPLAVQGTKRVLNSLLARRSADILDLSFAHEVWTLGTSDLLEAINAFKEKREGHFTGE